MLTFDMPVPFSSMGRRNVSNVPAQSLILMNDPFVVDQARQWAARVVEHSQDSKQRIEWMYESAFARRSTEQELAQAMKFIASSTDEAAKNKKELDVWSDFAHALINTKEFIFLR